jgi:hypothetical protein
VRALQSAYTGAGDGRLDVGLSIGVIWAMTEPGLRAVRRCADETGMTITMHINESPFDNLSAQQQWGRNTIPLLAECGLLGPDLIAVHCVHMTDEDIRLFVEYGVARRLQSGQQHVSWLWHSSDCGDGAGQGDDRVGYGRFWQQQLSGHAGDVEIRTRCCRRSANKIRPVCGPSVRWTGRPATVPGR